MVILFWTYFLKTGREFSPITPPPPLKSATGAYVVLQERAINTWCARFYQTRFARFARLAVADQSLGTPTTSRSLNSVATFCSGITRRWITVAVRSWRRSWSDGSENTCVPAVQPISSYFAWFSFCSIFQNVY